MGHFQPTSASAVCSGSWLFSAWPSFPWASLKLKQRQLPIQRLTLIFFMGAITDLDIIITVATLTTATMARGLLMPRLPLLLKLMQRLIPGWFMDMDTVWDTTAATDTVDTLTMATTARDLLRLSLLLLLLLMPRLIPGMDTTVDFHTTDTATLTTDTAMAMVTTGASKKGPDPIES